MPLFACILQADSAPVPQRQDSNKARCMGFFVATVVENSLLVSRTMLPQIAQSPFLYAHF
jgi:hypothetical protein